MKPIVVNIFSRDGEVIKKLIFVGNVSDDIKKSLHAVEQGKPLDEKLKKFFGPHKRIIGGDSTDEISISELPKPENADPENADNADMADIPANIHQSEEISLSDLAMDTTPTNVASNLVGPAEHLSEAYKPTKQKAKKTSHVEFIYSSIYNFDNILEFKYKLASVTGIPIYKQHVWYHYNDAVFKLNYNLFVNNKVVPTSIDQILYDTKLERIGDIPVLVKLYNIKRYITVKAYDTFSTIAEMNQLGVDEYNLISLDEFVTPAHIQQLKSNELDIIYYGLVLVFWPMITASAWQDYINNSDSFEKIYPDLVHQPDEKKRFELETKITDEGLALFSANPNSSEGKIRTMLQKHITMSVTQSTIHVTSPYTNPVISLRNLFDKLELNDTIFYAKCSLLREGKRIMLEKVYKDGKKFVVSLPLRVIMIRVRCPITTIDLFIYPDGNYSAKARWPEEKQYNFEDVFNQTSKYINPVIEMINKMGSYVHENNSIVEKMTLDNIKISDINLSLHYHKYTKYVDFQILGNILKDYVRAGILIPSTSETLQSSENLLLFHFAKGMYKFDPERIEKNFILENYYAFLSNVVVKNKWLQLFVYFRNTFIEYRNGDIHISIEGIKEEEFEAFLLYMIEALYKIQTQRAYYMPQRVEHSKQTRSIKNLKQQDPVLYDFSQSGSNIIYSKVCQKPYQPSILNDEELQALPEADKKRVIKYWNFTKNTPANYYCPNKKFPYLQFIVKRHPKDFCIPCCKVKPLTERDNKIRRDIFNQCLQQHIYQHEKKNVITDTRYIMNYGKAISPGRISNLPENTIEPLLYENFSGITSGVDSQCEEQNRYYVYGTEQHINNLSHIGAVLSIANALDLSWREFVEKLLKMMKADAGSFHVLLNGKIYKYFSKMQDLIRKLESGFLGNLADQDIPWNDIFIDLVYYYMKINCILFVDASRDAENIKIMINNKISTANQLMNPEFRLIMLIKKFESRDKYLYYPIYFLNSLVYFRSKLIAKKIYNHVDDAAKILHKLIKFNEVNRYKLSDKKSDITLSSLHQFTETNKKYVITKYFISNNNLCYYVEFTKMGTKFYVPIKYSPYTNTKNITLVFDCFTAAKYKTGLKVLNEFIKEFNRWIALTSEKNGHIIEGVKKHLPVEQRVNPIYEYIRVDKWLLLQSPGQKNGKVIGFKHNGVNYYHEVITKDQAKKLSPADFEQLLYHPDEVNETIHNLKKATTDKRVQNIIHNTYTYHLYELLILEFTEVFSDERNEKIRAMIKKKINDNVDKDSLETIHEISDLIENAFKKASDTHEFDQSVHEDVSVITSQINDYVINHHDKNLLMKKIDIHIYNFDKVLLNKLKTLPHKEVVKELTNIAKKIVTVVTESQLERTFAKEDSFSNILISCNDKYTDTGYCQKNRLMITKKYLDEYLEILAADILNPFKQRWVFNTVFSDQLIKYFMFEKHPNETIFIESQ